MLVDAHIHVDAYTDNQLLKVINQCEKLNIKLFAVSMDIQSYLRNVKLESLNPNIIKSSFGVHPWMASKYSKNIEVINEYLDKSTMVGEIGLDKRFLDYAAPYNDQLDVFEYILSSSLVKGKLLNLHTSGAEEDVLSYLQKYRHKKFIIHWYNGSLELLDSYLALGGYFTIGLEVLFSEKIQKILELLPIDRVLLETDNPSAWPWLNKQPENEVGMPNLLLEVLEKIAKQKKIDIEECRAQIRSNQKQSMPLFY
ncbi:TatD family hydrolase [Francisella frigiditurris]|uniref:TatD related DNase family protein n=1 Tax=Francisella frigiditurris TaxID=1542390 RepID=A0A1J0KS93_9GAMM|nr:TatD family hydrolase [Francisella frigiditurris]APC96518.1 tatD related DNase family protein [Francisella frigiditurris]